MLNLIASGLSSKQIAAQLGIAFKTVVCHRTNIIAKMNASNTADLIHKASLEGLLDGGTGRNAGADSLPKDGKLEGQIGTLSSSFQQYRETLRGELGRYRLLRQERIRLLTEFNDERRELEKGVQKLFYSLKAGGGSQTSGHNPDAFSPPDLSPR